MLEPKCKNEAKKPQGLYYSSQGYILPCCWLDTTKMTDVKNHGLLDENLKLSNNNKIEDILKSKQWTNFLDILKNKPECAPTKCKEMCGK